MSELNRPLTVRLTTRQFSRLGHGEVLDGVEKSINIALVKAVQITENTCFITLKTKEAKERLIIEGINIRDIHNNVFDVDKIVTNVTIKDAPYELSDAFLIQHLNSFGEVLENSLKRGKIKDTEIEAGTRYVQLVNCKGTIPITTSFGRFRVRLFSDNKTECKFCKHVGHPYFKCPEKDTVGMKRCYRCNSPSHLSKDCENEIVCHHCGERGHRKLECEVYNRLRARNQFGEYADEILEGQQADNMSYEATQNDNQQSTPLYENPQRELCFEDTGNSTVRRQDLIQDDMTDDQVETETDEMDETDKQYKNLEKKEQTDKHSKKSQLESSSILKSQQVIASSLVQTKYDLTEYPANIVLGDSNSLKIHFNDPDAYNISESGASAAEIDKLLEKAATKVQNKNVKRIVMHLGTNDVSKHKNDPNQVILETSTAIGKIHSRYPDAEIAFSSVLQRRGNSPLIKNLNQTCNNVNEFMMKTVQKEKYLFFLNNDDDLLNKGVPIRAMYDSNDIKGVHLSSKGAEILEENIQTFFDSGLSAENPAETPSGKRNRSVLSNTPPSEKQTSKLNKK